MRNENRKKLLLLLIILLAFFLRLYKIDGPIADWHSWRQADTSSVSRNFVKYGIDLLHPRYDDLSNVASGKDNPMGYRFVEFPIYNALTALIYTLFPLFTIEIWGRLLTIFASLGSLAFLYLITIKYLGERAGILTAFFFAVLPYNIYFGRIILPDPHLVFWTTGAIYFFDKWLEKDKLIFWLVATLMFSVGLLTKIYALFLLPVFFFLIFKKFKFRTFINIHFLSFIIVSFLPIVIWRLWMAKFPEGIPAYTWLFNSDGIRFRPAFFRWILYERLTKLILGFGGIILLLIGFLKYSKKESILFFMWAFSMVLYVSVIATGNVRHDYYQIFIIPIVCIFLGKGVDYLLTREKTMVQRAIVSIGISGVIAFSLFNSWETIKTYYWINNQNIIEAGRMVDKITPKDAKVIAPYGGDTAFLYQTNRQGWPVGFEIEDKIKKGASYYVNTNVKDLETQYVMNKWHIIKKTDKYIIVKLTE